MAFNIFRKRVLVKQRPVCADCGNHTIEAHGLLLWNEKLQDWQITEAHDRGNCSKCGNTEAPIVWQNY